MIIKMKLFLINLPLNYKKQNLFNNKNWKLILKKIIYLRKEIKILMINRKRNNLMNNLKWIKANNKSIKINNK
jgi:hypothetical protein